jgi:UDP-N-acetylmuramate--alanine ligase
MQFELAGGQGSAATPVALQIPGEHNVQNALAALAVADQLGLPLDQAAQALAEFRGTGRRFEVIGEAGGVTVIDDYAHHPTEIRATLAAAKARYPGRPLWAVWQPHTYSRVKTLFKDFADSFYNADHVLVTEVYRAREPFDPDFSARQILPAMRHPAANFAPTLEQAAAFLLGHLQRDAVLVVLSAGDANQVSAQVLAGLASAAQE